MQKLWCDDNNVGMNKKIKKVPGSKRYIPQYNFLGRPSGYTDEVLLKTVEYLDKCEQFGEIPYIQELELIIGVDDDVMNNWTKALWPNDYPDESLRGKLRYPDFNAAIKRLKRLQELKLLRSSMYGYSATGSIFQLKTNHGYIETEKKIVEQKVEAEGMKELAELAKQKLEQLRGQTTTNQ